MELLQRIPHSNSCRVVLSVPIGNPIGRLVGEPGCALLGNRTVVCWEIVLWIVDGSLCCSSGQ